MSTVISVHINSVLFASHVHVGDNMTICPWSDVLAVLREVPAFRGDEGDLDAFLLFASPLPWPTAHERVRLTVRHADPVIRVRLLDVKAVSVSSVLQIGANRRIQAASRTKHIRQLLPRRANAAVP